MPCLGNEAFRSWAYSRKVTDEEKVTVQEKYQFRSDMDKIIERVAKTFGVAPQFILVSERDKRNHQRWVAIYLCQEVGSHRLINIAKN
jgi:chromosomal replication initiation ATPase DnaA